MTNQLRPCGQLTFAGANGEVLSRHTIDTTAAVEDHRLGLAAGTPAVTIEPRASMSNTVRPVLSEVDKELRVASIRHLAATYNAPQTLANNCIIDQMSADEFGDVLMAEMEAGRIPFPKRPQPAPLASAPVISGIPAKSEWDRLGKSTSVESVRVARDDGEAGVIYGYSVITIGEALGHGFWVDETTLAQVLTLGKAAGRQGVKSRFTHPNLSGDGLGKYLGRSRNFRPDGDRVRADLYLSRTAANTPSGDLANYVLDLAEEDPKSFGASIVSRGDKEPQRNADGTLKKGKDGKPLLPLYRVRQLHAVDVVDEPAANPTGLQGATLPDWHVRQATAVLDQLFADASPEVIRERVHSYLTRYLSRRAA